MNHYLVIYRSITQAQMASRYLKKFGINNQIQRTPIGLTERGCSYSLRIPERYWGSAFNELRELKPSYYKVFKSAGSSYSEVVVS